MFLLELKNATKTSKCCSSSQFTEWNFLLSGPGSGISIVGLSRFEPPCHAPEPYLATTLGSDGMVDSAFTLVMIYVMVYVHCCFWPGS